MLGLNLLPASTCMLGRLSAGCKLGCRGGHAAGAHLVLEQTHIGTLLVVILGDCVRWCTLDMPHCLCRT